MKFFKKKCILISLLSFSVLFFLFSCSKKDNNKENNNSNSANVATEQEQEKKTEGENVNQANSNLKSSNSNDSSLSSIQTADNKIDFIFDGKMKTVTSVSPDSTREDFCYIVGMESMRQAKRSFEQIYNDDEINARDIGSFIQGMQDFLAGKELDNDYVYKTSLQLEQDYKATEEKRKTYAKEYLERVKKQKDAIETQSGLVYVITNKSSNTQKIDSNDKVNVDYKMEVFTRSNDGTEVLKEADAGVKAEFEVSHLISGLVEGLCYLNEGDSAVFYINPELGYGSFPQSPNIPADATLVFTVTINSVKKAEVAPAPEVSNSIKEEPSN